jgi:hypothetical protein
MIQLQRVLGALAQAFAVDKNTLVDRIQKWDKEHGREAALTPDTYHNFKTRQSQKAHLQTAIVFLEYLANHSHSIKKKNAAEAAREMLLKQLEVSKKNRFERDIGHDHTIDAATIDRFSGAYALCRVESQTRRPSQELVVLSPAKSHEKTRYATYVSHDLIIRGRWHVLGPAIYVEGLGYRPGHQTDYMNLSLARSESVNVLGGFLTGLATANRDPVTMSVLAIKIENIDSSIFQIGDNSDPELIAEYAAVIPRTMDASIWKIFEDTHNKLVEIPEYKSRLSQTTWFDPKFINATDLFVAQISGVGDPSRLVMPGLTKFCQKKR